MNVPENTLTTTEYLKLDLFDDEGNAYKSELKLDVNKYEVTILGVLVPFKALRVKLNNPSDDIIDAIRREYKDQEIIFDI